MFRFSSRFVFAASITAVSALSVACGGTKANGSAPGGETGDGGLPACGTDPAKQADQCIDSNGVALCKANTGFPGDEFRPCAPDPATGMYIHVGPEDYSDTEAMNRFILPAGGEEEFCMHIDTTNTEQAFFTEYHGRMRPHSHHWIVTIAASNVANETAPYVCPPTAAVVDRWLFGSQSPQMDVTNVGGGKTLATPGQPDYGAAHDIPAKTTLLHDIHYVNSTDQPLLRETWATLNYVDPASVKVHVDLIAMSHIGMQLPPMGHFVTPRMTCAVPTDASGQPQAVYLGLATAHAHQRMQRASVYKKTADGTETLVYESHNWHEQGEAYFRDGLENPALPVANGAEWGAKSGYLQFLPGESLSYECEYQNDQNKVVTFGDTTHDEMCELFGFYYPSAGKMWSCLAQ